jgi:hypothetical protein
MSGMLSDITYKYDTLDFIALKKRCVIRATIKNLTRREAIKKPADAGFFSFLLFGCEVIRLTA